MPGLTRGNHRSRCDMQVRDSNPYWTPGSHVHRHAHGPPSHEHTVISKGALPQEKGDESARG
jgi:hypothetical protein